MNLKKLDNTHEPIIILGAARSGTKILRDTIAAHPLLVPIPYDVNFVWKYGLYDIKHDELSPDELTKRGNKFIHHFFSNFHQNRSNIRVVEKTVSNTVRVDFVHKVFPNCQFIHIIRDGRDVAVSSMKQWQAPLNRKMVLNKLKYFPIKALPNYALQYALSYFFRIISREKRVLTWGVVLRDLEELLDRYSLLEVCGIQWQRCVTSSINTLKYMNDDKKIEVRYESLVENPTYEIQRLLEFLNLKYSKEMITNMAQKIRSSDINKWEKTVNVIELRQLMLLIQNTMNHLGYLEAKHIEI